MSYAMVTSKTMLGPQETSFGHLQFIPVACYAYTVGKNTMRSIKNSFGI